ncbi:MAG: glycosyltransferase family 4 protein [Candidatus Gorgyraea atricola]|nr:glycosyltransferase family 4 protein [Candidatus Gorgyraea atricola]
MNITLLFTYNISLEEWSYKGLIDRELLIYHRFIDKGHKVNFITYGGTDDLRHQEKTKDIRIFPVYERAKRSRCEAVNILKSLFIPFKFRDVFKNTDIIKINQMQGAWVGLIAKYIYHKKLVVRCGFEWYRNAYIRRKKTFAVFKNGLVYILEWLVYKLCDEIIISNETDAEFIKSNFNIRKSKVHLIRNYVDTAIFKPLNSVKKEGNRLLYIGRFEPRKNILNILKAVKDTLYALDIIGYGEEKDLLNNFVRDNSLNVVFLDILPNNKLPTLLNKYNALILASLYENSPKVILEAMSCGVPVIGADVSGIRELIRHRENGFLCDTDPSSIRAAVDSVMRDPVLRNNMAESARRYIMENCDIEIILEKEQGIYNSLTN